MNNNPVQAPIDHYLIFFETLWSSIVQSPGIYTGHIIHSIVSQAVNDNQKKFLAFFDSVRSQRAGLDANLDR